MVSGSKEKLAKKELKFRFGNNVRSMNHWTNNLVYVNDKWWHVIYEQS
jgi:hypothetical protein